jgi:hypothetical protein
MTSLPGVPTNAAGRVPLCQHRARVRCRWYPGRVHIREAIAQVKREFQATFTMTDEGLAQEFLGVRITQNPGELILDQENYCRYIGSRNYSIVPVQKDVALDQPEALYPDQEAWLQRFPYATILGKIVYLNAITRPNISFAVSRLSRFMANQPMLPVADSPACSTTYTTQPSSDFDTMAPSLTFMLTPIATGPHYTSLYHG